MKDPLLVGMLTSVIVLGVIDLLITLVSMYWIEVSVDDWDAGGKDEEQEE